ncbi:MAG: PRTRC system protein A [Hydrogenophaga sp.]|uniref:PRTRC system protein A n=1 Tax=Hydrogenophaga sp. TaxID=1904254 RepID=UPI002628D7D7|nr:PRTRC system protein A [Hydrogenophaga sp.]MCV0439047.1 PRTRC system protein A [Hydrogenophaga sp.]
MNNMDKAILSAFPLVAVPTAEPLQEYAEHGVRFLVGKTGVMREVSLPWLQIVHPVASLDGGLQLPYGELEASVRVRCSRVPADLIRQFTADARAALPNEVAAALIWNSKTNQWRYQVRKSVVANAVYVQFEEVRMADSEHLVVDFHSHGEHRAFFSEVDDQDDHGSMKFSAVLGNLDHATPSSAIRLCMAGLYMPAAIKADGSLEVTL